MRVPAAVLARTGLVLALVLGLDQVTKALVRGDIAQGERIDLLGSVLGLVHVHNRGVAFGAFAGGGALVVIVVAVVVAALVYYFVTHAELPLVWLPTGMLIGGAVGNVIDRAHQGYVTDFVKLPSWPAFNVADIAITLGVLVLLWVAERGSRERDAPDRLRG